MRVSADDHHWPGCHRAHCTLHSAGDPAAVARRHRWKVGTRLEGDEGYGVTRITITAIGERSILARGSQIRDGFLRCYPEGSWVLSSRCWRR